jgi:hypothetical protein
MSSGHMDVVLVKLSAVIIVVMSLQSLTSYIGYIGTDTVPRFVTVAAFLFNFGIPVLIALLLWFFPATVIGLKVNGELGAEGGPHVYEGYLLIAVTLVGLYALVFGIIDLLYYESLRLAEKQYLNADIMGIYRASPETVAGRYTNVAQIILGIFLLLGRGRVAMLLKTVRTTGKGAS